MNKTTIYILIIIIALAGMVLIYNGQDKQDQPPVAEELTDVTVMMPYTPAMTMSQFYCAIDQGYYADEGLNVAIQHSSEGSMGPIKQVGTGKIKFGWAAGSSLVTARSSKDVPVVMVYQNDQNYPYVVITLKDSEIDKPEDLIGKNVAIEGAGSPSHIEIKAVLFKTGSDYKKVNFVPVGTAGIPTLLEKKADAMAGHLFHVYLLESMGKDKDINVIYGKDYANMVGNGIITNEETLKNNPELVKKFVRATDKGFNFAINNPEEAVDIYIKNWAPQYAEKRDFHLGFFNELISEIYQPDNYSLGQMKEKQWEMTRDILFDLGIIDKKTDVNKMYTDKFLPN